MKIFLVSLLLALGTATAFEEKSDPVELVVNGLPEGEALEISDVLSVKVKEHVNGEIVSNNDVLFPLTAAGIAAAQPIAPEAIDTEVHVPEIPQPVLPQPELPVIVQPVLPQPELPLPVWPQPELPIVPQPELPVPVLPQPELPQPEIPVIIQPELPQPELPQPELPLPVWPQPEIPQPELPVVTQPELPESPTVVEPVDPVNPILPEEIPETIHSAPNGEVFNNGQVQVMVNAPQEAGVFNTLQSWLSMVVTYFNGVEHTSEQII